MNDNMSEYKGLIKLIQAAPKAPVPDHFTQSVMLRLVDEESLSIWKLLRWTITEAGEIPWDRFTGECAQAQSACFSFLSAGLFFFFIGSILFSSIFFIGHASGAMVFILVQSILVLVAATSLVAAGMMIATDIPDAALWAKRAILVFGILMIANTILIDFAVKTTSGGVIALAFGVAGILTGMTLLKTLERRTQSNNNTFTGRLHNA